MTDVKAKRPWLAMVVLGLAQLMITLDNSIVMITLPSAQAELGFDDALSSWIVSAYSLPGKRYRSQHRDALVPTKSNVYDNHRSKH